jgi:hypothetical protein
LSFSQYEEASILVGGVLSAASIVVQDATQLFYSRERSGNYSENEKNIVIGATSAILLLTRRKAWLGEE